MFVAEKVLLLLVISLTANMDINIHQSSFKLTNGLISIDLLELLGVFLVLIYSCGSTKISNN